MVCPIDATTFSLPQPFLFYCVRDAGLSVYFWHRLSQASYLAQLRISVITLFVDHTLIL